MGLRSMMQSMYPLFMGEIGLRSYGSSRPANDPKYPLASVLFMVWSKQGSFRPELSVIESVAQSVVELLESARIRFRFSAPVINLRSEVDSLQLASGLLLRRLSDAEVTEIYGDPYWHMLSGRPWSFGIDEFVFEGEREEPLVLGDRNVPPGPSYNEAVLALLDQATLALRAFKQGPVGYTRVFYRPIGFCPTSLGDSGRSNVLIPLGGYHLAADEAERLRAFADLVVENEDPALKMGCRRLSDAQVRTCPEDQVIDAVIGMEAVLLAAMGVKDRGELKYRFSMNYAVLDSDPAERHRRFKLAKDLYDLRSGLAHGGTLEKAVHVGQEKGLMGEQAATRACEALRDVLTRLLPRSRQAPHRKAEFWEKAYFDPNPSGDET